MNWIEDKNGNRASVKYWGSEEAARASLRTLMCCVNCTNCSYCTSCRECRELHYGSNCRLSRNSHLLAKAYYFLPVSEPRSYTWLAILEGEEWRIRAGCRNFSIEEARAHWLSDDYDGPLTVKETVGLALDWLETKMEKAE